MPQGRNRTGETKWPQGAWRRGVPVAYHNLLFSHNVPPMLCGHAFRYRPTCPEEEHWLPFSPLIRDAPSFSSGSINAISRMHLSPFLCNDFLNMPRGARTTPWTHEDASHCGPCDSMLDANDRTSDYGALASPFPCPTERRDALPPWNGHGTWPHVTVETDCEALLPHVMQKNTFSLL